MQATIAQNTALASITQSSISVPIGSTYSGQNVNQGTTSLAQPNVNSQFAYFTPLGGTYGA